MTNERKGAKVGLTPARSAGVTLVAPGTAQGLSEAELAAFQCSAQTLKDWLAEVG